MKNTSPKKQSIVSTIIGLTTVLNIYLIGCVSGSTIEEPIVDEPKLTEEYVISIVKVYGVPYLDSYLKRPFPEDWFFSPVGQWAAVYEGESVWRIQGTVIVNALGSEFEEYIPTTWIYDINANRLTLDRFGKR